MHPCVLTNVSFEVDLPDDDEVQVRVCMLNFFRFKTFVASLKSKSLHQHACVWVGVAFVKCIW